MKVLTSLLSMALVWLYIVEKHEPIGVAVCIPGGIGGIFIAAWTLMVISILLWLSEISN